MPAETNWSHSPTGTASAPESWADRRSDCCRRGMTAPVLAVGDGAPAVLGRLAAGATRNPRAALLWHKQANVLAALAKSAHPSASTTLRDVCNAEDIDTTQAAVKTFELDYAAKYRNAVAKITDDLDAARVLQMSGRALDSPANRQPDRKYFRNSRFANEGLARTRLGWPSPTSSSTPLRPIRPM